MLMLSHRVINVLYIFPKSSGVRKASILALQNVYEVDDNVPSLGLFTERFYKRMLDRIWIKSKI